MPPIDKAERRDKKRVKAINSKYQNVRYRTVRAGESLVRREAKRKTMLEGKSVEGKGDKKG
jgi:gentisate 1,2-dioxygenase